MTKAAFVGLGLFLVLSAASLFGRTFWLFELLSHFRLQFALAGIVLALYLAARSRWLWVTVAAAVAAGHAVPTLPYLYGSPAAQASPRIVFRVMALNLRHRFADVDAVRDLISKERPDAVVLTELLPAHEDLIRSLGRTLAYRSGTRPRGKFDSILLSRFPIQSSRIHYPAAPYLPVIEAHVCRAPSDRDSCLTIFALHASRPDFAGGRFQDQTFALVAERLATVGNSRAMVVGDLNTTPYSYRFKDLVRRGRLTDAAIGAPWQTTWISRFPPFGFTLDHVLVGSALRPVGRRVAGDIGSDHFPLTVDVEIGGAASNAR